MKVKRVHADHVSDDAERRVNRRAAALQAKLDDASRRVRFNDVLCGALLMLSPSDTRPLPNHRKYVFVEVGEGFNHLLKADRVEDWLFRQFVPLQGQSKHNGILSAYHGHVRVDEGVLERVRDLIQGRKKACVRCEQLLHLF
jgi:hypothetical protein